MRVFHRLQTAHNALFRAANARLRRDYDMNLTQQALLFLVAKRPHLSMGELARILGIGKSNLTATVDTLRAREWIERHISEADGRSAALKITEQGKRAISHTRLLTKQVNQDLLAPFSERELQTIARFLDHIEDVSREIATSQAQPHKEPAK